MKIIVMSDSHGDLTTIEHIMNKTGDAHFHCGDSEIAADDSVFQAAYKVRGNCDMDQNFPQEVEAIVDGKKVWMVHGHEHHVKHSLTTIFYEAREKEVNIVLFGHSHLYGAEMKDGILFVNPGSTLLPRGGNPPTYAEIKWSDDVTVTIKNLDDEVMQTAKFSLK